MSTSIQTLTSFTGLSEVELQRRAQELVATGKTKGLSALDAALLASTTGPKQATVDAFGQMGAATQSAHVLEEPAQVMARSANDAGFAAAPVSATPSLTSAASPAVLDKASTSGSTRVQGFMGEALQSLGEFDVGSLSSDVDSSSRNIAFEQLKTQMQRIGQIQQLMSNVLNQTNETAKGAINNMKA
ncbi:MAG TPA: hypothetical protein VGF99_11965 [Myxococcota bacterium]